jgi:hypothetical protein
LKNGIPGKDPGMPLFYDMVIPPWLPKEKPRGVERINNFIREL